MAWVIVDSTCPVLDKVIPKFDRLNSPYGKADTIEELCRQVKLPVEKVVKTIKEYNEAVKSGKLGEMNPPCTYKKPHEVAKAPFYAVPFQGGMTATFGGPLINVYGQVVGINTMKMGSSSTTSVEGLGFAIPIASTAYMINDLIAYGEVHGEVVIGISVQIAPVILDSGETALRVMDVTPGGPGDEAGIQKGDLIVAADGEALTKSTDLLRVRRRHEAGETLKLLVERDGKRFTADVGLRESDT